MKRILVAKLASTKFGEINEDGATTMAISSKRMMVKPVNSSILVSKTGELICILRIAMYKRGNQ